MKDWRKASAYPDEDALMSKWRAQGFHPTEDTLLAMWRWEFLRRRDDYQKDYAEQDQASQAYWDEVAASGGLGPGQLRSDFNQMGAGHLSGMAQKYGVELIFSPEWEFRITIPGLFSRSYGFGYSPHPGCGQDSWGRHVIDARLQDEQILIGFDLSQPLAKQLKRARSHLEAVQAERHGAPLKPPRHHRQLWSKYLRALDARTAGETFENIFLSIELEGLPPAEYDRRTDQSNCTASGRQLWSQACDLMIKVTS